MEIRLTFNLLPVIAVLVSLAASYVPKFKDWFAAIPPASKQLFMAGLLAFTAVVVALLSLAGFLNVYSGPSWQAWVWYPLVDFVIALIANAGTYKATDSIGK